MFGKCHIKLSDEDQSAIENNAVDEEADEPDEHELFAVIGDDLVGETPPTLREGHEHVLVEVDRQLFVERHQREAHP